MKITITKPASAGKVKIIPSKTAAHRLLIAGALSGLDISDKLNGISKDVDATKKCLINMKSGINKLPCGESGSTLRFLIPVAGAIGFDADFKAEGRLPKRPLSELKAAMEEHGCIMSEAGEDPIKVRGKLTPGTYRFPGNVSSQYITGMLFALPLLDTDSDILIDGTLQSRPYIDVTLDVLSKAGIDIAEKAFI